MSINRGHVGMDDKIFLASQDIAALIASAFNVTQDAITLTATRVHGTDNISAYVSIDLVDDRIAEIRCEIARLEHEREQREVHLKERIRSKALGNG